MSVDTIHNRRIELQKLLLRVASLIIEIIQASVDAQSRGIRRMIFTLSKTVITGMMTLGRKELAEMPHIRAELMNEENDPPVRLMRALTYLSLNAFDVMEENDLAEVEQKVEGVRQTLNQWADDKAGRE